MQVQLTETAIGSATRRAKEEKKRIELADKTLPGLRLRITPAGVRAWVLGCRDREGRLRRFPLGRYPTLSLKVARDAARKTRQAVANGADPIAARRLRRAQGQAASRGEGTLRAMLDAYSTDAGAKLRSWPRSRPTVELVFGKLLDRPEVNLTVADLLLEADTYRAKASAAFAVRTLRPALKWAALRGHVPAEVALIHRRDPVRRRERVLDRGELAALLPVLRASERPHGAALRFMLLTLARREEVCTARWRDVDLAGAVWTIPAGQTKNRQPHAVPLSRQAVELLAARRPEQADPGTLVFSTRSRPIGEASPDQAAPGEAPLGNWDRETKAVQTASSTSAWHRHDLRRTGATMLGELGELPDIVEAALNHVSIRSPLAATYNRSRYRPQVAAALQRLADEFDKCEPLIGNQPGP